MNNPVSIIIFTLLYIFGIISFLNNIILQSAFVLLCISCYFLFFKRIFKTKYIFIFLFAFVFGIFNTLLNIEYDDNLAGYSDNDIRALAKVITIPSNSIKDRTKFYAEIQEAVISDKIINEKPIKAFITINDTEDKISRIKIGDTIELTGRLKQPQYSQNPSQFDYSKYLQYKKTFSLIYVKDRWKIKKRADNFTGRYTRKNIKNTRSEYKITNAGNFGRNYIW